MRMGSRCGGRSRKNNCLRKSEYERLSYLELNVTAGWLFCPDPSDNIQICNEHFLARAKGIKERASY
jgi:hypothetical protein